MTLKERVVQVEITKFLPINVLLDIAFDKFMVIVAF